MLALTPRSTFARSPATGRRVLPATGGGRRGLATAVAAAGAALVARHVVRAADAGLGHAHTAGHGHDHPHDHDHPHPHAHEH